MNGSMVLMPVDPDYNKPRQFDKILIIQMEDRLITDKYKADTVDDPRLMNDTYMGHDRTFALIEALEFIGEEPKTIAWEDFNFKADDGTVMNKEWLNLIMLR